MTAYIPLFPLNLVAFPHENLNLHIFEPRYKELMKDVLEGERRFGVVAYVTDAMEYGTEVEVDQVVRVYPDGRMDIRTMGTRAFKINKFDNPMPGKLYSAGEVEYLEAVEDADPELQKELLLLINEFYQVIQLGDAAALPADICTFDVAHKIGLSADQKYSLLQQGQESIRQQMLVEHLKKALPLLRDVEKSKAKVRMNGHFRHFDPLQF